MQVRLYLLICEMYVPNVGAAGIFPDKSAKLIIWKSNVSFLSKFQQTRASLDMSISKSKYDAS